MQNKEQTPYPNQYSNCFLVKNHHQSWRCIYLHRLLRQIISSRARNKFICYIIIFLSVKIGILLSVSAISLVKIRIKCKSKCFLLTCNKHSTVLSSYAQLNIKIHLHVYEYFTFFWVKLIIKSRVQPHFHVDFWKPFYIYLLTVKI